MIRETDCSVLNLQNQTPHKTPLWSLTPPLLSELQHLGFWFLPSWMFRSLKYTGVQCVRQQKVTAHLDVDALFRFLSVKQAFGVKVRAPRVLLHWWTNPLSFTGDDHIGIHSCGGRGFESLDCADNKYSVCFQSSISLEKVVTTSSSVRTLIIQIIQIAKMLSFCQIGAERPPCFTVFSLYCKLRQSKWYNGLYVRCKILYLRRYTEYTAG